MGLAGVSPRHGDADHAARVDLLRIKGLLNLEGSKGPVVFQAVQHLMHPPVELSAWPDADHASRVVFITRGVTEQQVNDLFAACKALGYVTGRNEPGYRVPARVCFSRLILRRRRRSRVGSKDGAGSGRAWFERPSLVSAGLEVEDSCAAR